MSSSVCVDRFGDMNDPDLKLKCKVKPSLKSRCLSRIKSMLPQQEHKQKASQPKTISIVVTAAESHDSSPSTEILEKRTIVKEGDDKNTSPVLKPEHPITIPGTEALQKMPGVGGAVTVPAWDALNASASDEQMLPLPHYDDEDDDDDDDDDGNTGNNNSGPGFQFVNNEPDHDEIRKPLIVIDTKCSFLTRRVLEGPVVDHVDLVFY